MAEYKWKSGSRHSVSARIAAEVCGDLEAQGRLTARNLVDVSRPEDAPLHGEFTWADDEAAEHWREHEARNIINAVVVVREDAKEPVRKFFTLSVSQPEYHDIDKIIVQEDTRTALLQKALGELIAFQKKYAGLSELAGLFAAIEEAKTQLQSA